MTAIPFAVAAFACVGLIAIFAVAEVVLHRADKPGGVVAIVLQYVSAAGAGAFALLLIQEVLSW